MSTSDLNKKAPDPSNGTGMDQLKNMAAGGIAAAISKFISQPLDVLKIRLQLQQEPVGFALKKSKKTPMFRALGNAVQIIYCEGGVRGLWRGHNAAQMMSISQGISQFWVYGYFSRALEGTPLAATPTLRDFTSGFLSGTLSLLAFTPIEMIKTRIIARGSAPPVRGIVKTLFGVISKEGYLSLYKGGLTGFIQVGPLLGGKFMFYHIFCKSALNFYEHDVERDLPAVVLLTAGGCSGGIANFLVYPLEVVKRRMQLQGSKQLLEKYGEGATCTRIVDCLRMIVRRSGSCGLYKGIGPSLVKTSVSTAVIFCVYDKVSKRLDELI